MILQRSVRQCRLDDDKGDDYTEDVLWTGFIFCRALFCTFFLGSKSKSTFFALLLIPQPPPRPEAGVTLVYLQKPSELSSAVLRPSVSSGFSISFLRVQISRREKLKIRPPSSCPLQKVYCPKFRRYSLPVSKPILGCLCTAVSKGQTKKNLSSLCHCTFCA